MIYFYVVKIPETNWHWHHNISGYYYHIQLTVKYDKLLFDGVIDSLISDRISGFKERYYIEIQTVDFDKNHVHFCVYFYHNIQEFNWLDL